MLSIVYKIVKTKHRVETTNIHIYIYLDYADIPLPRCNFCKFVFRRLPVTPKYPSKSTNFTATRSGCVAEAS